MNIGHNNPPEDISPVDAISKRLEREYKAMVEEFGEIEFAAFTLPDAKDIKTEDDAEKVTAYIQACKAFNSRVGKTHKAEKEDFLKLGKAVDDFFYRGFRDPLLKRIETSEELLRPYLTAKAEKLRIQRELEAEAARKAAAERQAQIDAENAKLAKLREEQEAAAKALREAADAEAAEAAAAALQEKLVEESKAQAEADALAAVAAAEQNAEEAKERALKRAPKGPSVKKTYEPSGAANFDAIRKTMGPLGPYLTDAVIMGAIERAGREATEENPPPTLPGIVWNIKETAIVRAARGTNTHE